MKKEEILKKAQEDNSNDEYERTTMDAGDRLSFGITLLACVVVMFIKFIANHQWDLGIIFILAASLSTNCLLEGKIYGKKWKIIVGIIFALIAAGSLVFFLVETI